MHAAVQSSGQAESRWRRAHRFVNYWRAVQGAQRLRDALPQLRQHHPAALLPSAVRPAGRRGRGHRVPATAGDSLNRCCLIADFTPPAAFCAVPMGQAAALLAQRDRARPCAPAVRCSSDPDVHAIRRLPTATHRALALPRRAVQSGTATFTPLQIGAPTPRSAFLPSPTRMQACFRLSPVLQG